MYFMYVALCRYVRMVALSAECGSSGYGCANPARGQLNRKIFMFFPCPRSRLRIWSRETGSAVPSRVSSLILRTQAKSRVLHVTYLVLLTPSITYRISTGRYGCSKVFVGCVEILLQPCWDVIQTRFLRRNARQRMVYLTSNMLHSFGRDGDGLAQLSFAQHGKKERKS